MSIPTFTKEQVKQRAKSRPEGYYEAVMSVAEHVGGGQYCLTPRQFTELRRRFVKTRKRPTAKDAMTFARAAALGRYVSDEVRREREATCEACPFSGVDDRGRYCNRCGCGVSSEQRKIRNLAAYEENLPKWGCKHPERVQGKGWKR